MDSQADKKNSEYLDIVSNRSIGYNSIYRDLWQQTVLRAEKQAKPHMFSKHHHLTGGNGDVS